MKQHAYTRHAVNLRHAWLVLRWVTMSGFNSLCRTFILVCNQPPKANSAFHHSEYQMNARCAGKTVRSLENACHT